MTATVGSFKHRLMAAHKYRCVRIFLNCRVKLSFKPGNGGLRVFSVNCSAFTVNAYKMITVHFNVEVKRIVSVSVHILLLRLLYGLIIVIGLFIFVIAHNHKPPRRCFAVGKDIIPRGCKFVKLAFLGTVRHITQNKYRVNILFLVVIQHGINITVYSGSTVMKMQVAHDPEFYAAAALCGNRRKNKRCENNR